MYQLNRTQAFRAFNRAMAPLHSEMASAHYHDGLISSEFSSEAIDRHYDQKFDEAQNRVLARLGFDDQDMFEEEMRQQQIHMSMGVAP